MTYDLPKALRAAAKDSGWSAKRDTLSKRVNDYVLAVHPSRVFHGIIEFRAKPVAWDHLLWSILQIAGNEKQPVSFHFIGAFTCHVPSLLREKIEPQTSDMELAQQIVCLSESCRKMPNIWEGYDLHYAIEQEQPRQSYDYYVTCVVEQIWSGNRQKAFEMCELALAGELDVRHSFSSTDKLTPSGSDGRRPSLSFFQLAQLWMSRHPDEVERPIGTCRFWRMLTGKK